MLTVRPVDREKTPDTLQEFRGGLAELQPEPNLPPQVTACLGERLRASYKHLMNEPIPDDLLRILDALDQNTTRAPDGH